MSLLNSIPVAVRFKVFVAHQFTRNLGQQLVVWILLVSILCQTAPAAPQTIVEAGRGWRTELGFQFYANGWPAFFQGLWQQNPKNIRPVQEQQNTRDERVTRLQIYPENVTLQPGAQVQFVAVGFASDNQPVSGLNLQWKVQDTTNHRNLRLRNGLFAPNYAGTFEVEVKFRNLRAITTVTRAPGPEPNPNATPGTVTPVSTRGPGATAVQAKARKSRNLTTAKSAHASAAPAFLPDDGWNSSNYLASDDCGNRTGNVPGAPADGGAGNGNFQFAAPVLSLPGRGIDLALGLAYNSRLWAKANNEITYDIDKGWPAPGWNLGFGKIIGIARQAGAPPGQISGALLVEPDGTRHSYEGTVTNYGPGQNRFVGHTTDGSFIDYEAQLNNDGKAINGSAYYPNGTIISYLAHDPNGTAIYPTSITDSNGNYVTIAYQPNNVGPRISVINDTLGRTIYFHYDSNNLLTAITAPTIGGNTRELVRLHYKTLALSYGFSGLTTRVANNYPYALDAIYYPATGTGYWFGDEGANASYSSYGMLAKIVEKRGMSLSAANLNEQGTVTPGDLNTQKQSYDYDMTANFSLTDAPTYTHLVESWTKDGVTDGEATTIYNLQSNANPRTVTITLPNGLTSTQYSYNEPQLPGNPNAWRDGLVYQDTTTNGTISQSSSSEWQKGAYNAPRPVSVTATDERQQTTGQEFTYGSIYNQVTETREYGYGYVYGDSNNPNRLLRRTTSEYENGSQYLWTSNYWGGWGRHIFNLPKKVETYAGYAGGGVKMARAEYQYDGQTLIDAQSDPPSPGVVHHDITYNPNAPPQLVWRCVYNGATSANGASAGLNNPGEECEWELVEVPVYNPNTAWRGNVTLSKNWADATNNSDPDIVEETRQYDITGNLRVATTACCQQMSYNYTNLTQFAYPQSQTRGSADANNYNARVTTSAVYDFHTGLPISAIDADGRETETTYNATTLRPQRTYLPQKGAANPFVDYSYDDTLMTVETTTKTDTTNGVVADHNIKLLNGRGQVRQEQAEGAGGVWDYVDTVYNNLGQSVQQSRPYCTGGPVYRTGGPVWTNVEYDGLGRTKKVIAPDGTQDGSITEYFYNEVSRPDVVNPTTPGQTTRVKDAWGRERWGRTDAQGRLVEVVEPDPNGNGALATNGLATTYDYDALGRLTQTNQGAQTRKFKYDSLGRLTRQKLAETEATLNEVGDYVGAATGLWSDAFSYDLRSNLVWRRDARGVKATFAYNSDPLNRLQSVTYDTTQDPNHALQPNDPNYYLRVLDAATVNYAYRTRANANDLLDVTDVAGVTTAGVSTETYVYDAENRVKSMTTALNSRSGSMTTGYLYDPLDRVNEVYYPNKVWTNPWTEAGAERIVKHEYDTASRLTKLQVNGVDFAADIVYNAASQTESLKVGKPGGQQFTESYSYHAQTGLLENQQVKRLSDNANLLNLNYNYANAAQANHITGQLVKTTDNRDGSGNHNRSYVYDALGRLTQATGGPATPLWTQNYIYDRYGNRTTVTATGNTAGTPAPACLPNQIKDAELFVQDFYQRTLQRQPTSAELNSWTNQLRQSYWQGAAALNQTVAYLGRTLFKSQEYINLGRSDAQFVSDLYWAFLQREPDGQSNNTNTGWGWWTAQVPGAGRDAVRDAFANDTGETAARNGEMCPRTSAASGPMPTDGLASLTFNAASNRITTAGFQYDAAGNQTQTVRVDGSLQRFQYDAANRLVKVFDGNGYTLQTTTYGATNARLIVQDGDNYRTYYAAGGIAEYTETPNNPTTPAWSKSYIYMGARLLTTFTPNGAGETVSYHHPDRLGTRLITDSANTVTQEQVALPFGTALDGESTGASKKRFTSYDRSAMTGLDYAVNRTYDAQQGRFTQVDPIGMSSTSLDSPQSLNLYNYCGNDPINHTDPSGLIFGWLKRAFYSVVNALIRVVTTLLGLPTFTVSARTPGFNPNAPLVIFGGPGALNSSLIIYNFAGNGQVPLTGWWLKIFNENISVLRKKIYSKKCTEFLRKAFGAQTEYVQSRLLNTLNNFTPFDGRQSTITQLEAGLIRDPKHPEANLSIQNAFKNPSVFAATGAAKYATRYDVYIAKRLSGGPGYRFSSATILHEAFHGTFLENEGELLDRLRAANPNIENDGITVTLRKGGCGN